MRLVGGDNAKGLVVVEQHIAISSCPKPPDLVVRGTSQPVNYLFVQQGLCNVTSGDQNFKPCMFSAMQETQPSNSLSLAG